MGAAINGRHTRHCRRSLQRSVPKYPAADYRRDGTVRWRQPRSGRWPSSWSASTSRGLRLYERWQRACPFTYTGRHGSRREDILGTWVLSLLGERRRSARMNAICFDGVMPELLEVQRVVAEDAVRRFLKVIDQTAGMDWLQAHLAACIQP